MEERFSFAEAAVYTLLKGINHSCESLDKRLVSRFKSPTLPCVFILGQPRGGSTLLHQLLIQKLSIGYISNYLARFWKSPYIGSRIAKIFTPTRIATDYSSRFGITRGVWEPNEWGYYWRRSFGIDLATGTSSSKERFIHGLDLVERQLAGMQAVCGLPMVFDNLDIFHYLVELAEAYEKALFIYIKRDTFYVANSILNAKLARFGSLEPWYALRPTGHEHISRLPHVEQCVAQVHAIENDLEKQIECIDPKRIFHVEYEDLCCNPQKVISDCKKFIEAHGCHIAMKSNTIPQKFTSRNHPEMVRDEFRKDLSACYDKYFHEASHNNN